MTTVTTQALQKCLKRKALRQLQKADIEGADVTCWGRLFQVRAAAIQKGNLGLTPSTYIKRHRKGVLQHMFLQTRCPSVI